MAHSSKANTSGTVQKALRALQIISDHCRDSGRYGLNLKEIAEAAGFDPATTYRYLQSLEEYGLIQKDDKNRYKLGLKIVELYHVFDNSNELRQIAYDHMVVLSKETQETVFLGVLDGLEVSYIERVDSPLPVRPFTQIGGRNRLYSTGLGKALLAFAEPDVQAAVLGGELERMTETTITDPEKLAIEMRKTVERGFSIDNMENEEQIRCVGAPIHNSAGKLCGALSISGPGFRVSIDRLLTDLGPKVKATAEQISKAMGYRQV
ncbi:IclR family transcriptional regulator [Hydrogenispora ethanolica]|jgi:DNA-binding IclR family transcriptional regulator|uniref:IclR family transcriptional regulator n=1 Tax=Hydrogenispora ethanolica TaxID=1082276 RepID=A0A4R1S9V3_HYDET|nr:IclR family transcriptional regulator [Hydrogenispora ethanolica]TCL76273.1 IclR family transcriptional regulator [Hydrogenispora ethanolica]